MRITHWKAPMTWTAKAATAQNGEPMILRIYDVPGAAKSETCFAFVDQQNVDLGPSGRVTLVKGDGTALRWELRSHICPLMPDAVAFDRQFATAEQYSAPRSPIAGMIVAEPSAPTAAVGGDLATLLGGAVAGSVMPLVEARIEEAMQSIESRVKGAIVEVAKRPVVVNVPSVPEIRLSGDEHGRFQFMLERLFEQRPQDRNVLLWGERGSGKSTAAKMLADKLGRPFGAVSFSAGASESLFTGRFLPSEGGAFKWRPTPFTRLYTEGGVFCLDELDKADPQVATALNMALANGEIVTTEGEVLRRHEDFIAVGGANSLTMSKVYSAALKQDASLLDRFIKVRWDLCPTLLRNVLTSICGVDKTGRILRIRENVNGVLKDKRYTEWDLGFRVAQRMAFSAAAGHNPVESILADEVAAMAAQYEADIMVAARR
jgi:MoxR-like ATPase